MASMVTGCATPQHTVNYAPSSTLTLEGETSIGDFRYIPGEIDDKITPNQIRNTALGEVKFNRNVDEFFEAAVFNEARLVGIKIKKSSNIISGEIIEFLIDDLGYSIDWSLEVRYIVTGAKGDRCYDEIHIIQKNTTKFSNVFGSLNEVIKLNIEKSFQDPAFVKCLNKAASGVTT